jgi:hypothetical protein
MVDDGAPAAFTKMQVSKASLQPTQPFHGAFPGCSQPLGHVHPPVTFSTKDNFRTEIVTFDVADIDLPYNTIIGCPAIAKFMGISHYAYLTVKMPRPKGVILVKADPRNVMACIAIILAAEAFPRVEVKAFSHPKAL